MPTALTTGDTPLILDMDQALADLKELRELAALQSFDLFGLVRELSDAGASVLCCQVDKYSARSASDRIARYKLADRLLVSLAALRARHVHPHVVEGRSCEF